MPPVGDDPFAWKERHFPRSGQRALLRHLIPMWLVVLGLFTGVGVYLGGSALTQSLATAFAGVSILGVLWWVMSAKKEETRQRRLAQLIEGCEKGERLGQFTLGKKSEKVAKD